MNLSPKFLICFIFTITVRVKGNKNTSTINYKNLFKDTLVAYDCQNPHNVTSYELNDVTECESRITQQLRKNTKMQILQKTGKYTIPAIACSWKRTRKVVHCGSQDHMVIDFKKSFTSKPQAIASDECWRMFNDRDITLMQTHASDTSKRWKIGISWE